jgi:hypothetical protein
MRKIKIGMNKIIPMDNGGDRVMKLCQARLHMSRETGKGGREREEGGQENKGIGEIWRGTGGTGTVYMCKYQMQV